MYQLRIYNREHSSVFCKTKDRFGGLSNMSNGYPLCLNDVMIWNSEALYQAMRFPLYPEIQRRIISTKSPISSKKIAYENIDKTREDWDLVKVKIMRWCLRVKLSQNFLKFGLLLESTYPFPIVEFSNKNLFWGANIDKENDFFLIGVNALGRLLMELRAEYMSSKRYDLLIVAPLCISNNILLEKEIIQIDETDSFVNNVIKGGYGLSKGNEI